MSGLDEFDALTASLGEMAVDTIGKDRLRALEVLVYPHEATAFMTVILKQNDDAEQRYAIDKIVDIQQMFEDEITVDFVFADRIAGHTSARPVPQFSYA